MSEGTPSYSQPPGTGTSGPPENQPITIFSPAGSGTSLAGLAGLVLFSACFIPKYTNKPEEKSLISFAWNSWKCQGNGLHHPKCSKVSYTWRQVPGCDLWGAVTFCSSDCQQLHVSGTWHYPLETEERTPLCSSSQATNHN